MQKADVLQILDNSIQRQPQAAAELLSRFGYYGEPSPEALMNAAIVYKEPFANGLYALSGNLLNFTGTPTKEDFNKWLQGAVQVWTGIDTIITPPEPYTPPPAEPETEKLILGINPTLFYVAAGAIVLVILVIIFGRGK